MGPSVRPGIQFSVSQAVVAVCHRRRIWRAFDLRFEQPMQTRRRRVRSNGVIEALQQLRAFFLGNQIEFADGATMRARSHRVVEQHQQMLHRTQHLFVSH